MGMTLDERIKQVLEAKSEWPGSEGQLWDRVSAQLNYKSPWWQRQNLWLGGAAAAIVILAFVVQTVLSPMPPELPESQLLRTMPALFFEDIALEQPLVLPAGAPVELLLEFYPLKDDPSLGAPTLQVWAMDVDGMEALVEETPLTIHKDTSLLAVITPKNPGSYRLVVQGMLQEGTEYYGIYAEQQIELYQEEGR